MDRSARVVKQSKANLRTRVLYRPFQNQLSLRPATAERHDSDGHEGSWLAMQILQRAARLDSDILKKCSSVLLPSSWHALGLPISYMYSLVRPMQNMYKSPAGRSGLIWIPRLIYLSSRGRFGIFPGAVGQKPF